MLLHPWKLTMTARGTRIEPDRGIIRVKPERRTAAARIAAIPYGF
jgi:hypothetical protein